MKHSDEYVSVNDERLSEAVGQAVTLWPLLPADSLDHYRRGAPSHQDLEQELRAIFGRAPDEPLPDLALFPPELLEFESPPGTYFDAFPLMLLSQASLSGMQERSPDSRFEARRFRPNLIVAETDPETAFPEQTWRGRCITSRTRRRRSRDLPITWSARRSTCQTQTATASRFTVIARAKTGPTRTALCKWRPTHSILTI